MIGVYKISNVINSKIYIGSSINIEARYKEHIRDLKNNNHHNIYLQRFVNKYGIETLNHSVIEECDTDIILKREQFYIDNNKNLFNLTTNASAPMMGKHHSNKSKEKISYHSKGKNNPMYGKKRSLELIEKLRNANIGVIHDNNRKLKRLLNCKIRKEVLVVKDLNYEHCFSLQHAAHIVGVKQQSISSCIRRKTYICNGFVIVPLIEQTYTYEKLKNKLHLFDNNLFPQPELIEMLKSLK